jgi:hypothetical protein
MPDINEIPDAADTQRQLADIERAIASLKAGSTVFAIGVSAPPVPPADQSEGTLPVATRVELYPAISDPTALANIITALEGQQALLIAELEAWGYTYTGSAHPPLPPPSARASAEMGTPIPTYTPPPITMPPARPPMPTMPPFVPPPLPPSHVLPDSDVPPMELYPPVPEYAPHPPPMTPPGQEPAAASAAPTRPVLNSRPA